VRGASNGRPYRDDPSRRVEQIALAAVGVFLKTAKSGDLAHKVVGDDATVVHALVER
jgi:hypothetical protein